MSCQCKLISLIILFTSNSVFADPEYDVSKLEVGYVASWVVPYGRVQLTYLGSEGSEYEFEVETKRKSAFKDPATKLWTTLDGQITRMEYNKVQQIYSPHNCSHTVGRCEFTYTYIREQNKEHRVERFIRVSSLNGDLWTYKKYKGDETPENLRSEGTFTVDEFGLLIDSKGTSYSKEGKPSKSWRKRTVPAKKNND